MWGGGVREEETGDWGTVRIAREGVYYLSRLTAKTDRVTRTGNAGLYRAPTYTGRPNSFAHTSPHALSLQPSGTREGTGKVWGV